VHVISKARAFFFFFNIKINPKGARGTWKTGPGFSSPNRGQKKKKKKSHEGVRCGIGYDLASPRRGGRKLIMAASKSLFDKGPLGTFRRRTGRGHALCDAGVARRVWAEPFGPTHLSRHRSQGGRAQKQFSVSWSNGGVTTSRRKSNLSIGKHVDGVVVLSAPKKVAGHFPKKWRSPRGKKPSASPPKKNPPERPKNQTKA